MTETNGTQPITGPRLKLLQAMFEARKEMKMVGMTGHNDHDDYDYSKLADFVTSVEVPLENHGLLLTHEVVEECELPPRKSRNGYEEQVRRVKIRTTCTLVENGEEKFTEFACEGMDPRDKANLKANTGAKKYAIGNLFNLKTGIDPESVSDGRHDPPRERRPRPDGAQQNQQRQPANKPAQQQPAKSTTFQEPPGWPNDSTTEQLLKWIDGLALNFATWKRAFELLLSNTVLTHQFCDEWEPVFNHFGKSLKAIQTDAPKWNAFAHGVSQELIDAFVQLLIAEKGRIESDKQGREVFSPPAQGSETNEPANQA